MTTPPLDFIPGTPAPDFSLKSTGGAMVTLADIRGPNGVVIAFICNHCPYVRAITDKLVQTAADLAEIGVGFAAICANDAKAYPADSFEKMCEKSREWGLNFPYLHDEMQAVARAYGAVCTPDFFGYDSDLGLRYRGRLDAAGKERGVTNARRELYDAMCKVAQTGETPAGQVPSIGCSIKWRNA